MEPERAADCELRLFDFVDMLAKKTDRHWAYREILYICGEILLDMETITINSIDEYNRLYQLPTRHPLVAVVDLKDAQVIPGDARYAYGVYAIFLKNGVQCSLNYGRRSYDYQEGTVVRFAPGQVVDVKMDKNVDRLDVVGIIFHPDLIFGTPLADKIGDYGFFDYSQVEALHLSDDERAKILDCLEKINDELVHPVDSHSASLLSANIQVLLEYLYRFYDRQFITRHKVNSEVIARFERDLKDYYKPGHHVDKLPTVAYFADKVALTPGYFGDLVRKETGCSPKDLISLHVIKMAKQRLASSSADVGEIAYGLGFDYPAHFSRMFKRLTGQSPSQYRESLAASN